MTESRPTDTALPHIQEVIAKLEAATEGSRELDFRIQCAAAPSNDLPMGHTSASLLVSAERIGDWSGACRLSDCPLYTTSIDAALTLVPKPYEFLVRAGAKKGDADGDRRPFANCMHPRSDGPMYGANAATPALALCIAALRARSQTPTS